MAKHAQTPKGEKLRKEGQRWLSRIKEAEKLEKDWMDDADKAVKAFTGSGMSGSANSEITANYDFNILFSNVETIVPAIINSPPVPDIRRRFGDEDPVAKDFAELIERAISIQVDDSRLQVELEAAAQDAFLAGRGLVRLKYKSDINGEPEYEEIKELAEDEATEGGGDRQDDYKGILHSEPSGTDALSGISNTVGKADGDNERDQPETISNERIVFEAVSWRDYRHGPAKRWDDRPWDAFRHSMPQDEIETFQDSTMVDGQMSAEERTEAGESDTDLVVWEVWCKKEKKVKFILEETGVIVKVIDDPLNLTKFFPIAQPIQPLEITGRLMPINPFAIYRRLAEELDNITKRIDVITRAMKVRGWYAGDATDLENVIQLGDNEFAPITNAEAWAAHGGIEKAIAFWPMERFAVVLKELYAAREQTKQAIYEITGISDIVRGASKASETLGAQEIKTQWGSLRIQKAQRALARCARDLFVMMAEIIPDKFTPETLQKMTGIQLIPTQQDLAPAQPQQAQPGQPPQQDQQAEQDRVERLQKMQQLNQIMKEKVSASYRVDVETDSTIRADLTRQKDEVSQFLAGSGAYFQAVGPLVQEGTLPAEVAIEIYAANSRLFNLGKSTEDAIESMTQQIKDKAKQPQQPDPAAIQQQADQQAEQQKAEMAQQKTQSEMQIKGMQAQIDTQAAQQEFAAKQEEIQGKLAIEEAKLEGVSQKAQIDENTALMANEIKQIDLDIKRIDFAIKEKDLAFKTKQANAPAKVKAA